MSWFDELISRIIWPSKRPATPKTRWEKAKARAEKTLSDPHKLWTEHRLPVVATAAFLSCLLVLFGFLALRRPGDILNPDASFNAFSSSTITGIVDWPTYGRDGERSRSLAVEGVDPPYRKVWAYNSQDLMEFSPISVDKTIYGMNKEGKAFALNADNGSVHWEQDVAELNASSPAYHNGRIFLVNLEPAQAIALDANTGEIVWERELPDRSESSPVVADGKVIFGSESGDLFALDENSGKIVWQTELEGSIKGGPALNDGVVYAGDYSGTLSAVNLGDGEIKWQSDAQGGSLGQAGTFYATPTVAYGRVYIGSKDGRMYSFEAGSGDVAWSHSTGDEIYAGAAVANAGDTGPTVYFGSLDGRVYALDAKNGEERWAKDAGGGVFGAGTVIGEIFYVANLGKSSTVGFTAQDGERVFHSNNGSYNPVISDGRRLYLTGYQNVTALKPAGPAKSDKAREERQRELEESGESEESEG